MYVNADYVDEPSLIIGTKRRRARGARKGARGWSLEHVMIVPLTMPEVGGAAQGTGRSTARTCG